MYDKIEDITTEAVIKRVGEIKDDDDIAFGDWWGIKEDGKTCRCVMGHAFPDINFEAEDFDLYQHEQWWSAVVHFDSMCKGTFNEALGVVKGDYAKKVFLEGIIKEGEEHD